MKKICISGEPEYNGYPKGTRKAILNVKQPIEILFILAFPCCVLEGGRSFSQNPTPWEPKCMCEVDSEKFEVFHSVADAEKRLKLNNK